MQQERQSHEEAGRQAAAPKAPGWRAAAQEDTAGSRPQGSGVRGSGDPREEQGCRKEEGQGLEGGAPSSTSRGQTH